MGTPFSGVLCGRATWQDGIPAYGKGGAQALRAWLEDRGVKNIQALNEVLAKGAKPCHLLTSEADPFLAGNKKLAAELVKKNIACSI